MRSSSDLHAGVDEARVEGPGVVIATPAPAGTSQEGTDMSKPSVARDHFLAHLHDVTSECMIWPYATRPGGYGVVFLEGRAQAVHILACIAHHGPRPLGKQAAHGPCHNPQCWNWQHLSWKTNTENQADRVRDGTANIGERHGRAKLSDEVVRSIRTRYATGGITQREIAAELSLNPATISLIVTRRRWAHVN